MAFPIGRAKARNAPRIVVATNDGYLLQLDAKTGALYKKFGKNGLVDLAKGVMEKFGGNYTPGATPAIYKNIAIISPTSGEQGRYGMPGDPRAFDLNTGKELWRFHTVPQPGEANFGDWGLNGWQDRRGPGSWVPMTVDDKHRHRLHRAGQRHRPELWRQPARQQYLCHQRDRAGCGDRQAQMVSRP